MGIASIRLFVWLGRTSVQAGEIGAEVRGGWGWGSIYLSVYLHTRPSLDLDNEKSGFF